MLLGAPSEATTASSVGGDSIPYLEYHSTVRGNVTVFMAVVRTQARFAISTQFR